MKKQVELTKRQVQLCKLLKSGKSDLEIAAATGLTHGTTRQYLHKLYKKLRVKNRTAAVVKYAAFAK